MKVFRFKPKNNEVMTVRLEYKDLGFTPDSILNFNPSIDNRMSPYPIPQTIRIGTSFNYDETASRFSPPPFAVVVSGEKSRSLVSVKAEAGWHVWNTCEFKLADDSIEVIIDLEGHTPPEDAMKYITVHTFTALTEENDIDLLKRGLKTLYPEAYKRPSQKPEWWEKPIFCGGGSQVPLSLKLEGVGPENRCGAYCIQGLYERWLKRLEESEVPIGTIIIDVGWSPGGNWQPNKIQWPNLRSFIDEQHSKGRHVLLWIPTWFYGGLPDSWCVFCKGKKLSVDPSNNEYREFLKEQVKKLISSNEGGFNADGFKIDMLQYTLNERLKEGASHWGTDRLRFESTERLEIHGNKWGCELLYQLQKDIYEAAKEAKKDCLITSSTVHPYFNDTFDMVRLHDSGPVDKVEDVFSAMKKRADLASAALPFHLIDTDNWIHSDYSKWLDYTLESYKLGVPCIFYAEDFIISWTDEPLTCEVAKDDLRQIGKVWRQQLL